MRIKQQKGSIDGRDNIFADFGKCDFHIQRLQLPPGAVEIDADIRVLRNGLGCVLSPNGGREIGWIFDIQRHLEHVAVTGVAGIDGSGRIIGAEDGIQFAGLFSQHDFRRGKHHQFFING